MMALFPGSIFEEWLKFDGTNLPTIQACQSVEFNKTSYANETDNEYDSTYGSLILNNINCAQVCNQSFSLFEPSNNGTLTTCGIWTTLISAATYQPLDQSLLLDNSTSAHLLEPFLEPFQAVGLNESLIQYAPSYADSISACLVDTYLSAKNGSSVDETLVPIDCMSNNLFAFASGPSSINSTLTSLSNCLNQICSTVTLNTDLTGIGVRLAI